MPWLCHYRVEPPPFKAKLDYVVSKDILVLYCHLFYCFVFQWIILGHC